MSDEERLRNAMIYGTSHPEIYKTAQDEEIERLRAENEKLREAYDTDALTISYNLGYTCGKDIAKDEIERLRWLLREAHVKMVENDLWVNLRQRVAAAIRESGE